MSNPGIRDLKVWQEAVALGGDVVRAMRRHSRRETKAFTDPLLANAGQVAAKVAEGSARQSLADQRESFRRAKESLAELETRIAIARNADLLPSETATRIGQRSQTVGKLIAGYIAYLDRQLGD